MLGGPVVERRRVVDGDRRTASQRRLEARAQHGGIAGDRRPRRAEALSADSRPRRRRRVAEGVAPADRGVGRGRQRQLDRREGPQPDRGVGRARRPFRQGERCSAAPLAERVGRGLDMRDPGEGLEVERPERRAPGDLAEQGESAHLERCRRRVREGDEAHRARRLDVVRRVDRARHQPTSAEQAERRRASPPERGMMASCTALPAPSCSA
nr:hypothetical protein [Salinarimonas rosea]